MSCERAATIKAADRGGSKGRIVCNGGTCTEERPCQLKCADIYESSQSKAVAILKSSSKKCDNSWSACDSSCTQTRVISELWTDGVCHEKERQKRSCHTGACIKSHPCHVPFVIRMEIGFQGRKSWSLKLKESIAKALVLAIGNETSESRNSLGAGDVSVVSTSSWGEGIIPGMKAMIEISIVEPGSGTRLWIPSVKMQVDWQLLLKAFDDQFNEKSHLSAMPLNCIRSQSML